MRKKFSCLVVPRSCQKAETFCEKALKKNAEKQRNNESLHLKLKKNLSVTSETFGPLTIASLAGPGKITEKLKKNGFCPKALLKQLMLKKVWRECQNRNSHHPTE